MCALNLKQNYSPIQKLILKSVENFSYSFQRTILVKLQSFKD